MGWFDFIDPTKGLLDKAGGLFGGPDASQIAKKNKGGIQGHFAETYGIQDQGYGQAEQAYLQAIQEIQKGFEMGKAAIGRSGDASRQRVSDQTKTNMGKVSQSLSQSGLYNTTLRQSAEVGVQGQADRQMQEIDQMLAGMLGNLNVQAGMATGQAYQGLGGLRANTTNARTQTRGAEASLLYKAGSPALPPLPSNPLAGISSALGTFAGLYFGGPAAAIGPAVGGGGGGGGGGWGGFQGGW